MRPETISRCEHQLFAEAQQLLGRVGLAEAVEHDEQTVGFAEDAEAPRIIAAFIGKKARGVEELQCGWSRLLGLEAGRQHIEARVGHLGHAGLPHLRLGRVGFGPGQPLEYGAFA